MTPQQRKALAEQLAANPLMGAVLREIEASAIERLIYAKTDTDRIEAQAGVRAARAFRDALTIAVNQRHGKGAPV